MRFQKVFPAVLLLWCLIQGGLALAGNPYEPGENVLHLWHLDEASGHYVDDNGKPAGDPMNVPLTDITGIQGEDSFFGFSKAFRPAAPWGASAVAPEPQSLYQGEDGSFTVEAIIQPDTITGSFQQIFTREGSGGIDTRSFQFRITPEGELHYEGLGSGNGLFAIPTTGPNAYRLGSWYHVAVANDAGTSTGRLYWTRLAAGVTSANELGSFEFTGIVGTKLGHSSVGIRRRGDRDEFYGLIDEVAISGVAWTSDDFIFPIDNGGAVELWNLNPSDGESGSALGILLSWMGSAVTIDPSYAVRFGTDPIMANNAEIASGLKDTKFNLYQAMGNLDPNTPYYWQVDVTDEGTVHEGQVWSFTTGDGTGAPGQLAVDEFALHMWRFQETTGAAIDHAYADPEDPNRLDLPEVVGDRDLESFFNCGNAFSPVREGDKAIPKGASIASGVPQGGYQGADGAFTIEAIINVEHLGGIQQIFSRENNGGPDNRSYQFRINGGQLQFEGIAANVQDVSTVVDIPTEGAHAFSPNSWYHVAATYDGTPGTTPKGGKFYWTRIAPGVLAANPIGEFALAENLSDTLLGITAVSVHRRSGYRDPLQGLVDEVRISSIAREADDMFLPAEFPPTYQASNPSPVDGAERVSPNTVLRWMAPTFTDSPTYAVRLGTDPDTANNPVIEAGIIEPALDVNGVLDEGTTYYWSVEASNGETYSSDDWSFTTYVIPDNLSGPYAADADTLHLWHLERQLVNPPELDPDDWYLDSSFPDSNDPALWTDLITVHGDRRDSFPGFGNAFHTYTHLGSPSGAASESLEAQSKFQGEDSAFTYEAIIKADDLVGAYGTQRLIDRGSAFQLSINNGDLLFVPSGIADPNMQGRAEIPTEDVHAFHSDRWYHVAVTFDGVSQGTLYWTEMFSAADQANQIGEFTMEPIAGEISSSTTLASPGSGGSYLVGLIDEVRISRIAREPDDFFFGAGQ